MTQCNTLNVKLSNSQLNKFKLGTRNGCENGTFWIWYNYTHNPK